MVDALGNPVRIEVSDHILAPKLISELKAKIVMADGGYTTDRKTRSSTKSGIWLNVFFKNKNEIAELLPATINFLVVFLLLSTLLVFLFG